MLTEESRNPRLDVLDAIRVKDAAPLLTVVPWNWEMVITLTRVLLGTLIRPQRRMV